MPHQPVRERAGGGLGKPEVQTACSPGIHYNIEPHVETLYLVPDCELRLLSAFDLATTFLVIVIGVPATVATTVAFIGAPWTASKVGMFVSLIAPALKCLRFRGHLSSSACLTHRGSVRSSV
ncbi:MAG: hypothetical protein OXH99_08050 [Bryobacterales bacterium]|nr:hypothetical protein [Bryobacterales bacterium]